MSMVGSRIRLLRRVAFASTVLVALASAATATAGERTYSFNFNQISLSEALRAYAKITGQQIIFTEDLVSGRSAPVLKGAFTAEDALAQLLSNTGLVVERSPSGAIMVRRVAASATPPTTTAQGPTPGQAPDAPKDAPKDDEEDTAEADRKVERVVVTGTHIRGKHPKSSPLKTYTAEDIERTGATTTEQFIQKLPQNFGTRTQYGQGATTAGRGNPESVNSVDLRGLGVSTTLTLLNGRRLGLAANGQAVDVSLIPVSAIERVEVLTDGASAIYGSDAIGGVVNFVLRSDFDGAETRASYGGVTSGGLKQGSVTQTLGGNWSSGHALASADVYSASALESDDRDYAIPAGSRSLTPVDQRVNALVTLSQDLGESVTVSGDFVFSNRDVKNYGTTVGPVDIRTFPNDTQQYFANVGLEADLTEHLNLSLLASYSNLDIDSFEDRFRPAINSNTHNSISTEYVTLDYTAMLAGEAFALPAGPVRFSIGAGYMDEESKAIRGAASSGLTFTDLGRKTTAVFGELLIPLISEEQDFVLARRLELSVAARYTSLEDASRPALKNEFGSDTVPKIGILWSPTDDLNVRGTYGESFRAPSLSEVDPILAVNILAVANFQIQGVTAPLLRVSGPSLDLGPEKAKSYTAGFDYRPTDSNFGLSATYFKIDYRDRVQDTAVFASRAFATPALYPELISHPTVDQIAHVLSTTPNLFNNSGISLTDPNTAAANILAQYPNIWLSDQSIRNLALYEVDGLDVSIDGSFDIDWGTISSGIDLTRIFSFRQQATRSTPVTTAVDVALRPSDLRGRAYISLSRDAFSTTLSANYVDDYENPFGVGGAQHVESWTTFDWNASYDFGETDSLVDGIALRLSVQNIFDSDPPFVLASTAGQAISRPVGFDPANANPLGRFIVFGVSKRW